jgi:anti-sigma B factor antagonist
MSENFSVTLTNDVTVATITGKVDGQTVLELQRRVLESFATTRRGVLDVTGVGYMSSAGFRLLLLAHRTLVGKGGRLALVGLADEIRDTMEMTGFLQFFLLSDSLSQALEQMSDGSASIASAR